MRNAFKVFADSLRMVASYKYKEYMDAANKIENSGFDAVFFKNWDTPAIYEKPEKAACRQGLFEFDALRSLWVGLYIPDVSWEFKHLLSQAMSAKILEAAEKMEKTYYSTLEQEINKPPKKVTEKKAA